MAAVAGCGGVRERNLAVRVGWEAWADLPAIGHEAEEKKEFFGPAVYDPKEIRRARSDAGSRKRDKDDTTRLLPLLHTKI